MNHLKAMKKSQRGSAIPECALIIMASIISINSILSFGQMTSGVFGGTAAEFEINEEIETAFIVSSGNLNREYLRQQSDGGGTDQVLPEPRPEPAPPK
mgnify:CR=1 FL=1